MQFDNLQINHLNPARVRVCACARVRARRRGRVRVRGRVRPWAWAQAHGLRHTCVCFMSVCLSVCLSVSVCDVCAVCCAHGLLEYPDGKL